MRKIKNQTKNKKRIITRLNSIMPKHFNIKISLLLSISLILLISTMNLPNNQLFENNIDEISNKNNEFKTASTIVLSEPQIIDPFTANNWTKAVNDGWVTGEGTSANPYLIKNININTDNSETALTIKNSKNSYFIINNTNLIGGSDYAGLELINTSNGTIANSTFESSKYGIFLQSGSIQNSISENTFNENSYGIYLGAMSIGNSIMKNAIQDNTNIGIFSESLASMNMIIMNFFLNNAIQAEDNSTAGNFWNSTGMGNFWNDYSGEDNNTDSVGDEPYLINDEVYDYKPIYNYDPMIIPIRNSSYVVGSTENIVNWTVIDMFYFDAHYEIYRNGELIREIFNWDLGEIKINIDDLDVGAYNFTLIVYDGLGGVSTNQIDFYVVNTNTWIYIFVGSIAVSIGIVYAIILQKRK